MSEVETSVSEGIAWKPPAKLREVTNAAIEAGRSFIVSHGQDTGGSPFVSVTVKWDANEVRITWHTRDVGSYRAFLCDGSNVWPRLA